MRPDGILILLAIVARNGVGPLPSDSESPILPLYERAIKNKVLSPFSWPLCFTVSFQASISFPQVQSISTDNIMSLIHAGRGRRREELPQGNYPTFVPHLRESSLKC